VCRKRHSCLELGLGVVLLGRVDDSIQLGGHHDSALDLDLASHEQLLTIGSALTKTDKVTVRDVNGNVSLEASNGSLGHGALALQIEGPGTYTYHMDYSLLELRMKERENYHS